MEVFIKSPVHMRLKQDRPSENVHSKIWQSDTTTFFLDRGESRTNKQLQIAQLT